MVKLVLNQHAHKEITPCWSSIFWL